MKNELILPVFADEAAEAAWWNKNRRKIETQIRTRMKAGQTMNLSEVMARAQKKPPLQPVTIRLPVEAIAAARNLAASKGLGYQTYIKLLLGDALRREARKHAVRT